MKYVPRQPREGINVSDTHPLSEAATLVVGVTMLFAFVTIVLVFFVEIVLWFVSPETEARWFSAFDPTDLVVVAGDDDERLEPARELLARLAAHWPESVYAHRLEISDNELPNAFAVPGGLIVVTSGLLDQAQSENELAFVLAHELGHFRNRDHFRSLGRGIVLSIVLSAVTGGGNFGVTVTDLTSLHFSRRQETGADEFGLGLVHAEYGHVADAGRFFERLSGAEGAARWLAYVSSHPASAARVTNLAAVADKRGWTEQGEVTPLTW